MGRSPSTLVDEATACLWGPGGGSALDYLRGRGLTEATVRAAGLGFTPAVMIPTRAGDRCFRFSGTVIPWRVRVVTIVGLLPITIIDGSSGWKQWFAHGRSTGGLFSLLLIVVPFPVVSRWWNGERTIDLAQTLIVHGTSFCVEPQRSCPRRRTALHGLGLRMANG